MSAPAPWDYRGNSQRPLTHNGTGFVPAIGPKAEIIGILESHYYDDGDGRAVDEAGAAEEIMELFRRDYGLVIP